MKELIPGLEQLANKLGVAAERLYWVLTRQQVIESIVSAVLLLSFVVIGVIVLRKFEALDNKDEWDWEEHPGLVISFVFLYFTILFLFVNFFIEFPKLFNPESGAISTIMKAL